MKSPNVSHISCDEDHRLYNIDIVGIRYTILYESNDNIRRFCGDLGYTLENEVLHGVCIPEMEMIFINKNMCYDKMKSILYHESIHALLDIYYGNMLAHVEEISEEMIVCLLTGLSHKQVEIYNQIYQKETTESYALSKSIRHLNELTEDVKHLSNCFSELNIDGEYFCVDDIPEQLTGIIENLEKLKGELTNG